MTQIAVDSFHTSDEAEEMIFRSKEVYDGAIPSGNSVTAMNLLKTCKDNRRYEI